MVDERSPILSKSLHRQLSRYSSSTPSRKESFDHSNIQTAVHGHRVLSTLAVVSLCYFNVCGGPIGSEQIISAGGPLIGLIGILVMPLVWCIPVALVTAELSTAFPNDGGYTVWVYHAFGPFLALQEGYLSWLGDVINGALYPGLLLSTITAGYGEIENGLFKYLIKAAISIILALPSFLGIKTLADGVAVLSVVVLLPFVVITFWGYSRADFHVLSQIRHEDMSNATRLTDGTGLIEIDWSVLVNVLFWNFSGFQGMSVFAGEVANPKRTYPVALTICVVLIILTYLLPLSASAGVNSPLWYQWEEGSFSSIAKEIGGNFLVAWVVGASVSSNIGMYMTKIFITSFELLGMAECGVAPSFLSWRHPTYDTPHMAIATSLLIVLGLVAFDFQVILGISNALSCLSVLLIMVSAIKLRQSHADIHRPFKVPGSTYVLVMLTIFPTILSAYILYCTIRSWIIVLFGTIAVLGGLLLYSFQLWTGDLDRKTKFSSGCSIPLQVYDTHCVVHIDIEIEDYSVSSEKDDDVH